MRGPPDVFIATDEKAESEGQRGSPKATLDARERNSHYDVGVII